MCMAAWWWSEVEGKGTAPHGSLPIRDPCEPDRRLIQSPHDPHHVGESGPPALGHSRQHSGRVSIISAATSAHLNWRARRCASIAKNNFGVSQRRISPIVNSGNRKPSAFASAMVGMKLSGVRRSQRSLCRIPSPSPSGLCSSPLIVERAMGRNLVRTRLLPTRQGVCPEPNPNAASVARHQTSS
jgi:hypothetical protein